MGLCVAALCMGSVAEAQTTSRNEIDLGVTDAFADGATDTTAVHPLPKNLAWGSDAAVEDGEPLMWIWWSFTAASTDSFAITVQYYNEAGDMVLASATALDAAVSGAWNRTELIPGFLPAAIRVLMINTDVTGTAATTVAEAILTYVTN